MADPYPGLAADYDWIFDDGALTSGVAINGPAAARLLQRCSWADLPTATDERFRRGALHRQRTGARRRPRRNGRHAHRATADGTSRRARCDRELRVRLEFAGLREVDTDYREAVDRYAVIAVAA